MDNSTLLILKSLKKHPDHDSDSGETQERERRFQFEGKREHLNGGIATGEDEDESAERNQQ
jgi:hypothetical protein